MGVPAGTLEIEIVAEMARLQQDMNEMKKIVGSGTDYVSRQAKAANDNLSKIGRGASAGIQQFSRDILSLKSSLDPAWAATQRYKQEVDLLQRGLDAGAISLGQFATGNARARQALSETQAELRAAAAGANGFSTDVIRLKASLDPAWAATQRYEQELALLQKALRQGAISQEVFNAESEKMRVSAGSAGAQLTRTSGAGRMVAVQFSQVAQQVAVGGNAFQALATQLPDIAVVMGNAQKSASGFARFLSGPWGIALTSAIAVAAAFATKLFGVDDATEHATKGQRDFIDIMVDAKSSYEEVTQAAKDYADQAERSRQVTILQIQQEAEVIAQRYKDAAAARELLKTNLELYQQQIRQGPTGPNGQGQLGAAIAANDISGMLADNDAQIKQLKRDAADVTIKAADAISDINSDPEQKIKTGFEVLRDQAHRTIKDIDALTSRLTLLKDQEKAAMDALHASEHSRSQQFGREIDLSTAQSIAARAGFNVTSGFRTRAEQQRLYDTVRTPQNPVAMPGTSAHERGNALDIAFGPGVTIAAIQKAYADEGVKMTKILKESGHFHIEWSTSGADKAQREAEALARKQKELADFGAQAAETIASINDRFNEQPRLVDSANAATRKLDATIRELSERKPPGFQQMIEDAQNAKQVVEDALVRPFRELTRDSERRLQVQGLLAKGREDEADALTEVWRMEDTVGKLTADQVQYVQAVVMAEKQRSRELQRQKALFDAQLDVLDQAKKSLTDILSGRPTNFIKDMKQALMDLEGKRLFDSLFGDLFQQLEDELRGQSPLGRESQRFASEMSVATDALGGFTAALNRAANDNAIVPLGRTAGANSPYDVSPLANNTLSPMGFNLSGENEIVVTAKHPIDISGKSIVDLATKVSNAIVSPFEKIMADTFGPQFAQMIGGVLSGFLAGKMTGGTTGGVLGALKGLVDNGGILGGATGKFSAALGKAMGGAAVGTISAGIGKALGINMSTTGSQIGGAIGSFIPIPGGSIIGAIAGGLLGSLFKKKPHGTAVLNNATDPAAIYGNKASARDAASTLAGSVQQGLQNIASQLGADLGSFAVSIGTYKDKYRVNTNGTSGKLGGYSGSEMQNQQRYGLYNFGSDSEAAIKFAIEDAIKDGALLGLRASTQALLTKGTDLDKQIQKALDFEGVFKELKSLQDPLGFAMDNLTTQFDNLRKIFDEAGASTEEYAQLEQLLALKRQQIIDDNTQQMIDKLSDQNSLEVTLLQLLGRNEDALALSRLHELSAMQASLRPMQAVIYQLQDAQAVIDKFGPLADDLKAFKQQILGNGSIGDSLATLTAQFRATAASARMGDATALGNLQTDAGNYLDAVKANAASELDFRRAVGEVLAATDQGIFAAETQVDYAQAQIDAIAANTSVLSDLKDELATYQQTLIDQGEWVQRQFRRWDSEGIRIQNDADTPIFTEAAA